MKISFDVAELEGVAERLGVLNDADTAQMRADAVDAVALSSREAAITLTTTTLNLTRDYVAARIVREQSKGASARITSQVRGTTLQRFGAQQQTKLDNWTNARIQAAGHTFGAWPGWTERTGDAMRKIPANFKQDGITVQVKRGTTKWIQHGFFMPLRNGNGMGVFARDKAGRLQHRYGPSVYQTFRGYITDHEQEISDSLRDEFMTRLDAKLENAL